MRYALAFAAVAICLALSGTAHAQVGPDMRFVVAPEAEVRSGPSTSSQYYVTNRLRRGQPVEVTQELPGGWLRIRPPEGSFSWINTRFLEHIVAHQPNYVVALDGIEVPVFIGSSEIKDRRPWVIGVKLKRGTQVTSKGATLSDQDGTWMPIEPPPGEGRYIRAETVNRNAPPPTPPARTVSAASPEPGTRSVFSPASGPPASTAPSANPPLTPEALWQKAQHAERLGQTAEAIRLYALVGAEAARSNPHLSALALQRASYLQGGHTQYGAGVGTSRSPSTTQPLDSGTGGARLTPPPGSRPAETTSRTVPPGPPPAAAPERSGWVSYRGRLRKAGRSLDDRPTYVLEFDNGTVRAPVLYVTGAGVDLGPYLDREVDLWGYALYRGDVRANHMQATRVVPLGR